MSGPSVSLFGSTGEMGRNILHPLLKDVCQLQCLDVHSSADEVAFALQADIIVFAIPLAAVSLILNEVSLRPDQLVIDICSCKRQLPAVVRQTGASHLCLHPMNGPFTPWLRQKWLLVGAVPKVESAEWFLQLLRNKKVMFHEVSTPEEHDKLMSLVLGLPEFFTVFVSEFMKESEQDLQQSLKVTSPAFASLLKTHIHTICSTPLWLRKELLEETHPEFLRNVRSVCTSLSRAGGYDKIEERMAAQVAELELPELTDAFVSVVREHATSDFDLMNTVFLGKGLVKSADLYIQKTCVASDITRGCKGKPRIGIHGIAGAFTDEAWYRFATEQLQLQENDYEIVELVHSNNVLQAVETGEVDRGIFAFANSGSGGYTASIEAMGKYSYNLLASFTMPIHMCILAKSHIHTVHDLAKFYGHPIALSQCRQTIAERWPDMSVESCTDEMDTALSAQLLAQGELPADTGVFASARAAQIYDLQVLEAGVHHDPHNATAFAVVTKS